MAVSKRTRFEVLKRDNHTCRYCGEAAPNVVLHVDHVIPVSLGGTDKPDNLVAACKDCNLGKSSTNPSDKIINDVNEQALAYSQALRKNLSELTSTYRGIRKVRKNLDHAWDNIADECGWGTPPPKATSWGPTLQKWLKLGLTPDYIEYAMEVALSKDHVYYKDVYRYFCGVIYRTLDQAHELTQEEQSAEKRCGHCHYCQEEELDYCLTYGELDADEERIKCHVCDSPTCMYEYGWIDGDDNGKIDTYMRFQHIFDHYKTCVEVSRG